MAKDKETEAAPEAPPSGGSKMKLILMVVGAIVLLGGGAGAYFMLSGGKEDADAKEVPVEIPAINLELDPFLVNLTDAGGKHYLRTTLTLEVNAQPTVEWINGHLPRVRDGILMLLSAKGSKELLSAQGKFDLRDEVVAKLNDLVRDGHQDGKVAAVYLSEFVVQ